MRILVALDQNEPSQVLDLVLSHSWPEYTEFNLLHVLEPFDPIEPDASMPVELWSKVVKSESESRRFSCMNMLESAASRLRATHENSEVTTCLLEGYMPAQQIVDKARDWKADLIIIGSHNKSGLQRFLLGSVSRSVLLNSPCSVEIVKKKPGCASLTDLQSTGSQL